MNTQKLKMYVLVRNDLNETYRNVQGCHAVVEYSRRGNKELYEKWDNSTLVHLKVTDKWSLERWKQKLSFKNREFSAFFEPDLEDEITALACIDSGEIFKRLPLA